MKIWQNVEKKVKNYHKKYHRTGLTQTDVLAVVMCEMNTFKTSISEIENGNAIFRNYGYRRITDI